MIRDQIVYGAVNKSLRERLLQEDKLTLKGAVQLCKAAELTVAQKATWGNPEMLVDFVSNPKEHKNFRPSTKCNRCHEPKKCQAFGEVCHKCKKKNHFAVCCKPSGKVSDGIFCEDNQETYEDFATLQVKRNGDCNDWLITASAAQKQIQLKADTGSQASLIPLSCYRKIRVGISTKLASAVQHNYSSAIISHIGSVKLRMNVNGVEAALESLVMKSSCPAILGLKACRTFGLVRYMKPYQVQQYSGVLLWCSYHDCFKALAVQRKAM